MLEWRCGHRGKHRAKWRYAVLTIDRRDDFPEHVASVRRCRCFSNLREYWSDQIMSSEKYRRGLALRKEVLGTDYVERSLAAANEFSRPMQDLSTEYCWGHVWSRPGLSRRDRSLLNIGMISALNRPHELKLHLRAALTNGLSREEIREALLQVAVYCGVPAGLDSMRIAREAFEEVDKSTR